MKGELAASATPLFELQYDETLAARQRAWHVTDLARGRADEKRLKKQLAQLEQDYQVRGRSSCASRCLSLWFLRAVQHCLKAAAVLTSRPATSWRECWRSITSSRSGGTTSRLQARGWPSWCDKHDPARSAFNVPSTVVSTHGGAWVFFAGGAAGGGTALGGAAGPAGRARRRDRSAAAPESG